MKWLNEFAEYYNHELQSELHKLQALYSHANIIFADYYNAALPLYRDPTKFGNLLNSHCNLLYVCFQIYIFILHENKLLQTYSIMIYTLIPMQDLVVLKPVVELGVHTISMHQ